MKREIERLLFATAAKGTEGALRDELRELGFRGVRAARGGVHFAGALDEGYRACLGSRIAVRVLYELAAFDAPSGDALYEGVRGIDWARFLTPRHTLEVRAACKSSALTHTQFIAQRTKDGVVDPFRERTGERPSVDLEDPDFSIFVHLVNDHATVYADLAGASLHRRGYRVAQGEAPLKETLAATALRLGGWDRERPLVDPMCGSGTIAIEGALWARGVAPGLLRRRFGFERWASFDAAEQRRMKELRGEARARVVTNPVVVHASDVDPAAVAMAEENARHAGVSITFRQLDVAALAGTTPPGHVVTNPPYGERLAAGPGAHERMAQAFERLAGHTVTILAGAPSVVRPMRARARTSFEIWNGDIPCRLLTYEMGARRD